ncbi:MAG TPA: hemerythrin domain-containing protein [Gallionellaceae bacterium]
MGLLARIIGNETGRDDTARRTSPDKSTGIAYDAGLVDRLKKDHQDLVVIYTAIKTAANEGRFHELPGLLTNLKLAFQTHVMQENVKFYVYVQQHYSHDADTANFIFDVRKEMEGIARALIKFVNTHSTILPTRETVANFQAELDHIGAVLMMRVQLEENRLYSLYQPA